MLQSIRVFQNEISLLCTKHQQRFPNWLVPRVTGLGDYKEPPTMQTSIASITFYVISTRLFTNIKQSQVI